MNKSGLKSVKTSTDLGVYKLNKALRDLLERFDKLLEWEKQGGRPLPRALRLWRHDLNAINAAVRKESDDKLGVRDMTYRGLPLIAHDEKPPQFELRAGS